MLNNHKKINYSPANTYSLCTGIEASGSTDHGWKPQDPFTKNKSFPFATSLSKVLFLVMEQKQQIPMLAYSSTIARLTFATLRLHIQLKSGIPFQLPDFLKILSVYREPNMQENPSQRFLKAKVSGLLVKVWMTRKEVLTHKPKYTQTDK